MNKALPGVIVILGVPIGMGVGGYFGHVTLGSVIGGAIGFAIGLVVLLRKNRRPDA